MEKTFQTSDLYLASALKINGFRLIVLRKNEGNRGIFFFEDRADRPQLVKNYFSGNLIGSLKAFSNAWADLKSLVNEIEMEKEHKNDRPKRSTSYYYLPKITLSTL